MTNSLLIGLRYRWFRRTRQPITSQLPGRIRCVPRSQPITGRSLWLTDAYEPAIPLATMLKAEPGGSGAT